MSRADRGDVGVPADASAWDVFVSYAHADVDAVSALVVELRDAGLTVWWDRERIDTFNGITSRLEEGIAGARVVVMCLSQTYPSRPACQWEALQVLRRLPQGDVAARLLPVAVTPGAGLSAWPILSDLRVPDAVEATAGRTDVGKASAEGLALHGADAAAWEPVVWAVRSRLEALPTGPNGLKSTVDAPEQAPVIWLPDQQARSKTFTGRFAELLGLHSRLASDKTGLDSGRAGVRLPVSVVGIGGVGKTMLVQEYVNQFSGYWPVVIKVNAAGDRFGHRITGDTQRAQWLDALAGEVWRLRVLWSEKSGGPAVSAGWDGDTSVGVNHPDQDQVWVARQRLERERARLAAALAGAGSVLWWVDDIPDGFGDDLSPLLSPVIEGATVFTSRSTALRQTSTELPVEPFEVTAFDDGSGAGVALLAKHRPGDGLDGLPQPIPPDELPAMREINRLMGGLPLALDVTGARVALDEARWDDAANELRQNPLVEDDPSDDDVSLATGHSPSVSSTFRASLRHLEGDSPQAMQLLVACCLLGPGQPIPRTLLCELNADSAVSAAGPDSQMATLLKRNLRPALRLRLLSADTSMVRVHELIAQVANAEGHLDGALGQTVRHRIAALATDPEWVIRAMPSLGLPTVTQVLETHDPNAPLARIVRNQAHNLAAGTKGGTRPQRTSTVNKDDASRRIATLLAWEALRQGNTEVYQRCRNFIEAGTGMRFLPLATSDRSDPRLERLLTGHAGPVGAVALARAPDDNLLALSVDRRGSARVWNALEGVQLGDTLTVDSSSPNSWAVTADGDGRLMAFGAGQGDVVEVWDVISGESHVATSGDRTSATGVPDARGGVLLVASEGLDPGFRVLDVITGEATSEGSRSHAGDATAVAMEKAPDGRILAAACSSDGTLRVWEVATGSCLVEVSTGDSAAGIAVAVATAGDGSLIAVTSSRGGTLRAWDVPAGTQVGKTITVSGAPITSVAAAFAPDGRIVAVTGSQDSTATVWDVLAGKPVGNPITGNTGAVASIAMAVASDGRVIAVTGSDDDTVRVWDVLADTPLPDPLTGHDGSVSAVAVANTPDGRVIAVSGSEDETVRVWDVISRTTVVEPLVGHSDWINGVALTIASHGTPIAVTSGWDDCFRVWSALTAGPIGHPMKVNSSSAAVAALADGRVIAVTGGEDHTVRTWDALTGTPLGEPLVGHKGPVTSVALTVGPDLRLLAVSGSDDCTLRSWDVLQGTPIGEPLTGHTESVASVAVINVPDGRVVAVSGSEDRSIRVWDVLAGTPIGDPLTGHTDYLNSVSLVAAPDGRIVCVSACDDRSVRVWDILALAPMGLPLFGHTDAVTSVGVVNASDGHLLAVSASRDMTLRAWDILAGSPIGVPVTPVTDVTAVSLSTAPDSRLLVLTNSRDEGVRVWDGLAGTPVAESHVVSTTWGDVAAIAKTPDGRLLTWTPMGRDRFGRLVALSTAPGGRLVSLDDELRMLDVLSGKSLGQAHRGDQTVTSVSLLVTEGTAIAVSGGEDGSVFVWDMLAGEMTSETNAGHEGAVTSTCICARPDGSRIGVTGGADGTVRVWDLEAGAAIGGPITGHAGSVTSTAIWLGTDGQTVAVTGGDDGTVRLWDMVAGTAIGGPLTGHTGAVTSASIAEIPEGRNILVTAAAGRWTSFEIVGF